MANKADPASGTYVVVGVDGSSGSQQALEWALHKVDTFGPIKAVAAYHVDALGDGLGTPSLYQDLTGIMAEDARNRLHEALSPTHPELLDRAEIVRGYPGPALVRVADDEAMLVVGSRGRSALAETLLGSVTSYCVKQSKVPVAVITGDTPVDQPLDHIVVGVDGSANAAAALRWAIRHVAADGRITAVRAWMPAPYALELVPPVPTMDAEAREALQQSIDRAVDEETESASAHDTTVKSRSDIEVKTVMGDARTVLPAEAADADLLVVGARGHRGVPYLLLGSVTTSLIHHPAGPTVIVPVTD